MQSLHIVSDIYRMGRTPSRWERIGARPPTSTGDIGFLMALYSRDPDTGWVFPIDVDATKVWPCTNPGGTPTTYVTRDAERIWMRQD